MIAREGRSGSSNSSHAALFCPLPGWQEPANVLSRFCGEPMTMLLCSAGPGSGPPDVSRWSLLCSDPFEQVSWSRGDSGDPFRLLEAAVSRHRLEPSDSSPFAGGAIGYIGYEVGQAVEPAATARLPERILGAPDMLWGLFGKAVVWDHWRRSWGIVSTGLPEKGRLAERRARADATALARRLAPCLDGDRSLRRPESRWDQVPPAPILASSIPKLEYLELVEEAKRWIAQGELYQVNISQRLELEAPRDPIGLYQAIEDQGAAPFSAYMDLGEIQIASASPERFVKLTGRRAECRPIKGTRPRGRNAGEDRRLLGELMASEKDRAENIMIADLLRNDLGRVCRPGSVRAVEVCRPESFASVHHLVSIIEGELEEGRDRADLLRALFPGGSMTGAPKIRAMQAIEHLEPVGRGVYSGALGYLSFCGDMDLSIVIRTAIVANRRAWLHVGGGVVADSEPGAEYVETLDKARSIRAALAVAGAREVSRVVTNSRRPRSRGLRAADEERGGVRFW